MFANHGKEDGIYPLTTIEIAKSKGAQKTDYQIYSKNMRKHQKWILHFQLIENIIVIYKDEINHPYIFTDKVIRWYHYHHYLQHPSHSRLKETMRSVIYWKGIHNTIRS
jgi:hypothetical protein